jgi:LPXTG-motif cell wall-anchored protein
MSFLRSFLKERGKMDFKRKSFWLAIMLVIVLAASGFQPKAFAAGKQGAVSVVGSDQTNSLPEKTVQYGDNETALDALIDAVGIQNVDALEYPGMGKYINGIYGLTGTADYKYYWSYFINGISAQAGVDSYMVQDGDKLSFQYVSGSPEKSVTLNIIGKDGKDLITPYNPIGFIGDPTALQLLKVFAGPEKLNYTFLTINGVPYTDNADSYYLKTGDKITFQYDSWNNSTEGTVAPVAKDTIQKSINQVTNFYQNKPIGEWETIALKQAGKPIPASYLEGVKQSIKEQQGKIRSITDIERYTLGILAAGGDPTNIEGYNLVQGIYNGNVTKQGSNGVIYGLIALDSAGFKVPVTAQWNREKLVHQILSSQNQDGGFALYSTDTASDVDITAMALTALAPYKAQIGVQAKIDTALQFLTNQFNDSKINNSQSAAQVIIALSTLGIDADGSQFTKDNTTLLQNLLTYQNSDGGFADLSGKPSDIIPTQQGFLALAAYQLFTEGKGSVYSIPLTVQKTNPVPVKSVPTTVQNPGHPLPDTGTNNFNLILLGIVMIMIGTAFFLKQSIRKA